MSGKVTFHIPNTIRQALDISDVYRNYGASGNPTSYGVDLELSELSLHRDLKSKEFRLLAPKVETVLQSWAKKYERHMEAQHKQARSESVEARNEEVEKERAALRRILEHTLSVDDAVDWASLKRKDSFRQRPAEYMHAAPPVTIIQYNNYGRPTGIVEVEVSSRPALDEVRAEYSFLSRLLRKAKIQTDFAERTDLWRREVDQAEMETERRQSHLIEVTAAFEDAKECFEVEKERDNESVDALRERYMELDPAAVEECCEIVLGASVYPDYFPQSWVLEYRPDGRILVLDYDLPAPRQLPSIESYRYVKAKDEIAEKHLSEAARKRLYESTMYQVCVRTLHELFEADVAGAVDAAVFNGCVSSINPATGVTEHKTLLSVMAPKADFETFDLSQVDPKATFKHLKGVAAPSLADLAAIPPVLRLERADKRFIEGREVVADLDASVNLASMSWDDFEHLIRELFEQEFAAGGGEVRVTQASPDGGVDAVVFDPDPIRGGKIVIQAKRYTRTVGVAAVRDLYGTMMNEGATKGILVTTADYGKDSYEFAKGKPLSLLNGNNLLSLLEKHGHRARINVQEARQAKKQ